MSIVLLGDMEENKFLLTGDVGLKGLEKAIEKVIR
jgi:possible hydrolase